MRAYRVAYDGRPFHGFQRQPDVRTVEGALLSALACLGVVEAPGPGEDHPPTPPGYAAAGRTDSGVSALAQTVAFEAPEWLEPRALNGELPADVRTWASAPAPEGFHATRDAAWRAYVYRLHAPGLDADRVRAALARLEGTHDFHNLTAVTDGAVDTRRTVRETAVRRDGDVLAIELRADGFLHEMVRRVVTLVAGAARGGPDGGAAADRIAGLPPARVGVDRALSGERLTGPAGIGPAPAEPLTLTGVGYPDLSFETDPVAARSLRETFGRRHREAATRARTLGAIRDGVDPDR